MKEKNVVLYDTTLRDGNQDPRVFLGVEGKLEIAKIIDKSGIPIIEGGWPGANQTDTAFFKRVKKLNLNARIAAFGSTCRKETKAEDDPNLKALVASQAEIVTIFGKSWTLHVTEVLRTDKKENLRMIHDSIAFLKSHGITVYYDAEHFFDGFKAESDYALETIRVAQEAGADFVIFCDTNGGNFPYEIGKIIEIAKLSLIVPFGIHCHNDTECAVANTLEAVRQGASQVQGTINGIGERCGNTNLITVIMNLQAKQGIRCIPDEKMVELRSFAKRVASIIGVKLPTNAAGVGDDAFKHKGGAHQHGVIRCLQAFEHLDPEVIGNNRRFTSSDQIGRAFVYSELSKSGLFPEVINKQHPLVDQVLRKWKERATLGYRLDLAPESALLAAHRLNSTQEHFRTKEFDARAVGSLRRAVSIEEMIRGKLKAKSKAEVELVIRSGRKLISEHHVAKGDGPVNALDLACRKALEKYFPVLKRIQLRDFRVRVIEEAGTASKVSVIIETSDNGRSWYTMGVDENILKATLIALEDSYEYAIWQDSSK